MNQETTKNPLLQIIEELEGHKEVIQDQAQEITCYCSLQGELEFQAEEIEKQLEILKSILTATNAMGIAPGEAK